MSSHGNTPSRNRNDDGAFVPLPGDDSSQDYSAGGRGSRDPLTDARLRAESAAQRSDLKFPEGDRYQQLSDPIPGGMGVVFKALDVNLDIDVAIKRIRPVFAKDAELIKRFEREAKVQVRLRHPHLVQVKDYLKDVHGPYIIMDWIDGQSLAAAIKANGPMGWREAASLISKVAMALQVAHENSIIHRDVKPANILLDKDGEPYITDFGLARAETGADGASETNKDAMLGTMHFMSPEQMRNPKDVTYLSDIWSLGATLHQLVTGFDVLAMRESRIPEPLRHILLQAIEREPADRFGTMKLFAQELARATESAGRASTATAAKSESPAEEDIADIWKKTLERVDRAHAEAKSLAEQKQDYVAAVKIMETIPEHLRKKKLYNELVRRRDRVIALDVQIRESVAQLKSAGLREAIAELLKLQPNREEMKRLLSQLPSEPALEVSRKALAAGSERAGSDSTKTSATTSVPLSSTRNRPALLVAPFDSKQAKAAQEVWAKHLGIGVEVTNGLGMKFRVIPPGTFDMGSPASEPDRSGDEIFHEVTITQPKLLGVYPVTQGEWTKLMGSNPSDFTTVKGLGTRRFPLEKLSWDDSQEFLTKLNAQHGLLGWRYRLPTEAEWEYACRAGTVSPFWFGGELNGKQANCNGYYPYQTSKGPYLARPSVVGSYDANPFGLYDQHGQVWEWCQDRYGDYETGLATDPSGVSSGSSRVLRGGSWVYYAYYCRSANRLSHGPSCRGNNVGFRVLCELS